MNAPTVSAAQLKASLWAQAGGKVHAVVDGRVLPGLPKLLEGADTAGWDCLQRGALSPEAARLAAYLVELDADAPWTDWLLGEAGAIHPGWGVLLVSRSALLPVREHCRTLGEVLMPDGRRRAWRWHDPELLAALLPVLQPSQLDEVFALGQQIVVPGPERWTWHLLEDGVLATRERQVLREAAR